MACVGTLHGYLWRSSSIKSPNTVSCTKRSVSPGSTRILQAVCRSDTLRVKILCWQWGFWLRWFEEVQTEESSNRSMGVTDDHLFVISATCRLSTCSVVSDSRGPFSVMFKALCSDNWFGSRPTSQLYFLSTRSRKRDLAETILVVIMSSCLRRQKRSKTEILCSFVVSCTGVLRPIGYFSISNWVFCDPPDPRRIISGNYFFNFQ